MTTLAGQTTKDDPVEPSWEIQRRPGHRHDVPGVTNDRFNQSDGEARSNNASDDLALLARSGKPFLKTA